MARQVKRKSHSAAGPEARNSRPKHGRLEMRTVHRTARRGPRDGEEPEAQPQEQEQDASEDEVPEEEAEEAPGMAYNALLTLLKSDHKPKKAKKEKIEPAIDSGAESDNDEVAGVNVNLDEDNDDEDEEEFDDDVENVKSMATDPFEVHFNNVTDEYIDAQEALVIKQAGKWSTTSKEKIAGYTSIAQGPPGKGLEIPHENSTKNQLSDYNVKKRLLDAFEKKYPQDFEQLPELDHKLADLMLNYKDINFPYKNYQNTSYRKLYILHALNHIFKTRDRVLKNTEKLRNHRDAVRAGSKQEDPEFRDQGFTRPKVLILLPTRNACYELVELLIQLSGSEQQENKKKFNHQFYNKEFPPENKPADFKDSFRGNNNDFFCIGMKFTRKTLKLYSSFYASDIIIASPIGLSMILENPDKKKRQYDFLSSIEVLVIDRANQIEMQNWDHILTVMKYINKIPKEFHDADFSRIRMWSINDQALLLRQTLVFGEYLTPNITNLLTSKSNNLGGKVKFKPIIDSESCVMNSIGLKLKQVFLRFDSVNPVADPDARFKFFINSVLPSLTKSASYPDGIMIFIPSYYDYLRVKHYMKSSTKHAFASIDEYSTQSKVTKTRQQFLAGKVKILLYTERLHYFRRYEISGVKTLLMYGLPSNPVFYKELVRFIGKSVFKELADLDLVFVKIMYSKWDAVALERIVGHDRAPVLCSSVNEMYEFR